MVGVEKCKDQKTDDIKTNLNNIGFIDVNGVDQSSDGTAFILYWATA